MLASVARRQARIIASRTALATSPISLRVAADSLIQLRPLTSVKISTRSLWTTRIAQAEGSNVSSGLADSTVGQVSSLGNPPPTKKKAGFFKKLRRTVGTVLLVAVGTYTYLIYRSSHPPDQLPPDPSKKTVVVLGSGWAATSFLKGVNTDDYNVIVISPHNYFLFTPLLPSVTVGTLEGRSIAQPTRHTTRFKSRHVQVLEASAEEVDLSNKTVMFEDKNAIHGSLGKVYVPYDYLVYAVGSENQTFGIKGVREHACFLKELGDAEKIRNTLMDCIEAAALTGQSEEEVNRLLHMVVVGGGPTGIEYAAELRDFVTGDLTKWYPEIASQVRVTLVEALPNILPMFSKTLIEYTEASFKENSIDILTKHMVKDVDDRHVLVKSPSGEDLKIPYGLLVWAAGNTTRPITRHLMAQLPDSQKQRRGLEVDDHLRLKGAEESIFALGDASATQYAPTAQAASQQGAYLARVFNQLARVDNLQRKIAEGKTASIPISSADLESLERQLAKASKIRPFHYTHQGSLAYIGKDKAIADISVMGGSLSVGGFLTYALWRSSYLSMLFSLRNRSLVAADWLKVYLFGRDVSRE